MRRCNVLQSIRRRIIAVAIALALVASTSPALSYAQQTMNAQSLTAEGIALTAVELGPDWSVADHRAQKYDDGSEIYVAAYSSPSGRRLLLTTGVAPNADILQAVLSRARYDL